MYHSLDICRDIGIKFSKCDQICHLINDLIERKSFFADGWPDLSLAYGLPGIACFYGVLDQILPNEGWDDIAHTYLKQSIDRLESRGSKSDSLFFGLTGLCFAIYLCSKQSKNYQQVLSKLDDVLINNVRESFFLPTAYYLDKGLDVPPFLYNLMDGISGLLSYSLLRKDHDQLQILATDCIHRLIQILKQSKYVDNKRVFGCFSPSNDFTNYPGIRFILSTPYGIPGCLSSLSIAACEGIHLSGLFEIINEMADWLKNQQKTSSLGIYWPSTLSFDEDEDKNQSHQNSWFCGIPAITRSLYLASKATKNQSLSIFAEKTFVDLFSRSQNWSLVPTNFSFGLAGFLATTYRMMMDTRHPVLIKEIHRLEEELKQSYQPNYLFGFQMIGDESGNSRPVENPGLFNGAIGIAMSLLLLQGVLEHQWDRAFLLS